MGAAMSVTITIKNVVKRFGQTVVIPDLSLVIREGEFFTLLGPSGCGKTTLLRMIAGFNTVEGGDIYFNDRRVNDIDPAKRNIGMVFQNYAIFPHLSVRSNVAFGLKYRNLGKQESAARTDEFLRLVRMEQYADRLPEQLSGGQQQRVALARALAIHPDVLLMDEPLSNLDAKLRVEMRAAIREIQRNVGITTVYVTHDQEEAMAVSDRIAVMRDGRIQQVGTPRELYHRPSNLFVATFIGYSNVLDGDLYVSENERGVVIEGQRIPMTNLRDDAGPQKVLLSIRPEDFVFVPPAQGEIVGVVEDSTFLGLNTHSMVKLPSGQQIQVIQQSASGDVIERGNTVHLAVRRSGINVFDAEGDVSLLKEGDRRG